MTRGMIDVVYDDKAAKTALEQYALTRKNAKTDYLQLSSFDKGFPEYYDVIKPQGGSKAVRLGIYSGEDESSIGEAVVRYQGVLCEYDLPPIRKQIRIDARTKRYMSQSISVIGLGSATFDQAYDGIYAIAERMSRYLEDSVLPTLDDKEYLGYRGLRASNRYFSWKGSKGTSPSVPFTKDVDPSNFLQSMLGSDFEHTKENEVIYMACTGGSDGKPSYTPKDPATFLPGDIVEVQVSFAAFQTRDGNNKLEIVLRGLTLLDDRFSKAARIAKMKSDNDKRTHMSPIGKRKTGYEDDDTEITRKKMKGLSMADGTKDGNSGS